MVATAQEVKVDRYEAVRTPIRRLLWASLLAIVLSLGIVTGVVAVVVYSGVLSIHAFEELPRYRVNRLLNDYNDAVKSFDQSSTKTNEMIDGDEVNLVLQQARSLPESVLQSEKDFAAIIAIYGEAMNVTADQIGSALEWKRYFQTQIDALQQQSEKRQTALAAIVAQFPEPAQPPAEQSEAATPPVKKR